MSTSLRTSFARSAGCVLLTTAASLAATAATAATAAIAHSGPGGLRQSPASQSPASQSPASLSPASNGALPLAVGRPAPDLGLDEWLGKANFPGAIGKVIGGGDALGEGLGGLGEDIEAKLNESLAGINKAMANARKGRKTDANLESHHKKVVLLHVIDWSDPNTSTDLIEWMRVASKANEDRGIQLLGIMEKGDKAMQRAKDAAVDWPVALTSLRESASPYITKAKQPRVFVIGRSGELVWQGSPGSDRTGFLAGLATALDRMPCERIERDLAPELDAALKLYYRGTLHKAIAAATRHSKAGKGGATPLQVHATHLIAKAHDTEVAWLQAMRKSSSRRRDFDHYVEHVDALVGAFPRTSGKEAKAHEKQASKKSNYTMRLRDERAWQKCIKERPVLFPARKDKQGDRFAKRLAKYVQSTRHATDAAERGQALLDRYRAATR